MICKCDHEMKSLCADYNGNDNRVGIYFWCNICGRIYYHYESSRAIKFGRKDFWMEPNLLEALDQ